VATYGGAVDLILTELARSDTSITAVVEREILKAIEHYAPTRFHFNEARDSFTVSNSILYPLASMGTKWMEIDQMTVTVNSGVIEMSPASHNELQSADVSGFTGYPTHWAIWAEQVRVYPKAASGSTYQVDVFGTKRIATLSASTDTNEWTTEGLDLIAARVEKVISARKFKDFDAARMYQEAEDQVLQRLLTRAERLGSTGRLSPGY
jgi:hypothetical protein